MIASGGVRSGIDVAKSIALGASMAGIALPLLAPASRSGKDVAEVLESYVRALRIAMFLTGSENLSRLQRAPTVIMGDTRDWLEQRGFDTKKFSIYKELA